MVLPLSCPKNNTNKNVFVDLKKEKFSLNTIVNALTQTNTNSLIGKKQCSELNESCSTTDYCEFNKLTNKCKDVCSNSTQSSDCSSSGAYKCTWNSTGKYCSNDYNK